jgi:hypothetical protein
MKIFILGLAKSGTTAMVYKAAGGLSNCRAFSGGKPGKYVGRYENAVYKHTYEPRKGKSFDLYRDHLKSEHYDRKIWMARDPRDVAVSRMLYRWHRGTRGAKDQYHAHLDLVIKKEKSPRRISFLDICRYTGYCKFQRSIDEVIREEVKRYADMYGFVRTLGADWFLFRYENMVANRFDSLNSYLGFHVDADAAVPQSTGKAKVVRKKASGDWRNWFTEADVEVLRQIYIPYMDLIGYDCEDWALASQPFLDPIYSSEYMTRLASNARRNFILRLKDNLWMRVFQ